MRVIGIIPARYGSKRLEGKPLKPICGKPMIEWVYKRALKCKEIDELIVATDDLRIFKAVEEFYGKAVMTPKNLSSGTDRVAYVAEKIECDVVLNIQGDEPLINSSSLKNLITLFEREKDLKMGTLVVRLDDEEELKNPSIVKVVLDKDDYCLYFSRNPIPYLRDKEFKDHTFYKHIGIYGFNKEFLLEFTKMKRGKLEEAESLEQLRALENGIRIKAHILKRWNGISVDTKEDLIRVEEKIKREGISLP